MTKDLTQGSPVRLILGFALPLLAGMLFQQLYNLVDTLIVGRFLGMEALAGVGATGSINFLVLGFCMGICSGFAIPVAQRFGAREESRMREFVANGNMAFICTGRTLSCIHPKLLELPWTGIVCLAGGYAEINGHAIRDLSMTPSMLQRLAPYLEQSGEVIRFEGLNGVVRMSADAPVAPGYARTLGDAVTQLQHYSVYKILMSTSLANHIAQDKALEPLLCFNELELEVTEISPRECTKRGGIQSVLDALDPHHGTVYGIGDASNDVSLMNAVDVCIAMGNAPDYLKDKADYVTDTVDHDGVVAALEHFRLI